MAVWRVFEHFHGEVTRVPVEATACELRRPGYNVALTSVWGESSDTDANVDWTRKTYDSLAALASSFRYVNYLAEDDLEAGETALRAAYGTNHARLAQVKRTYDPDNLFRLNLNIPPA